jgi:hypothetical protein
MAVALRGYRCIPNGCDSWWDNDRRLRMTLGYSVTHDPAIVRAVCRHRRDISIDLLNEVWQYGNVTDIIRRQFHRNDFMRISIDTQMQSAASIGASGSRVSD